MNKNPAVLLYVLVLALLLGSPLPSGAEARLRPEAWGRKVLSDHLDNWYQLDGGVYRSEQPDREGMKEIEAFGIKRILNLRWFHDDRDEAEGTGLQLFHVPMRAEAVTEDQVVEALNIIAASSDPILIHCQHGSDRTGVVTAMYRIIFQGWSKKAALDEMRGGGFGFHAIFDNIPQFIEDVDLDSVRKKLAGGERDLGLKPFTTDGCSAFPDGTLGRPDKWLHCCTEHDRAYWKGGTYEERLTADLKLRTCVADIGEPELAEVMFGGVRLGGSPYLPTLFRWGYGWSRFRGYQPLSGEDRTAILQLEETSRQK